MGKTLFALTLLAMLVALWLTLSGRFDNGLLIVMGVVSVVAVIFLVERMGVLDMETSPYVRIAALAMYWAWLAGEIFKANLVVSRAILRANLDITPRLFRVKAVQSTDLGRTVFANSITLTPGTVTVDIDGDDMIIHAMMDSMADPAGIRDMNVRAGAAVEGRTS